MSDVKKKVEKKPYEKPAVIHRQALEGVANACDPNVGGKGDANCTVINS